MVSTLDLALLSLERVLSKASEVRTAKQFLAFAKNVEEDSQDFIGACASTNYPKTELATKTIPYMRELLGISEGDILHMALTIPIHDIKDIESIERLRKNISGRREDLLQTVESILRLPTPHSP